METEAFQDLMEQSVFDRSTDGGSDSGENSLGESERRWDFMEGMRRFSRRADSTCEDSLHDQDLPDSASHGIYERKIKKKSQIHQVRKGPKDCHVGDIGLKVKACLVKN